MKLQLQLGLDSFLVVSQVPKWTLKRTACHRIAPWRATVVVDDDDTCGHYEHYD